MCAAANDFRRGASGWSSTLRNSILRANWTASSRPENERTEALRHRSALSAGDNSTGKTTRFYARRNPTTVLRFPQYHSGFRTLAKAVPEKARGTRPLDGCDKDSAALAEDDDEKLPLRYAGSMWQGDISEHECEPMTSAVPSIVDMKRMTGNLTLFD